METGPRVAAAGQVATSGLVAAQSVYYSLRATGRLVGGEVSDAAAQCAEHRLGAAAGLATKDGLGVLADLGKGAWNVAQLA